jgi:hypothetical protein
MPHLGVTGHLEAEEVDHSGLCQRCDCYVSLRPTLSIYW